MIKALVYIIGIPLLAFLFKEWIFSMALKNFNDSDRDESYADFAERWGR